MAIAGVLQVLHQNLAKRAHVRHVEDILVRHFTKDVENHRSITNGYLHRDYCITSCTDEERLSFVDKMYRLSQLTWSQLRQAPRQGLGYEKIDRESIRVGIPANVTEDVNFIAFRFCGKAPMIGYRSDDGTFYIIWFDRGFTVYKHG